MIDDFLINLIHNLVNQNEAPERILEAIIEVHRNFEGVRTNSTNRYEIRDFAE